MATQRRSPRRKKAINFHVESRSKAKDRAKTRSPKKAPRTWAGPEYCQLLAHLAWGVEENKDFWKEVFPRFKEAVRPAFTPTQVRGKLSREWGSYGRNTGQNDYNDVFRLGLEAFELPDDVKERVEPFLNRLRSCESSSCHGSIEVAAPRHEKGRDEHQATTKGASRRPQPTSRVGRTGSRANPEVINSPDDSEDELTSYRPSDDAVPSADDTPSQRVETARAQRWSNIIESKNREISDLKNRNFLLANNNVRLNEELRTLRKCNHDDAVRRMFERMHEELQNKSQRNLSFNMDKRGLSKEKITQCYETLYSNVRDACLDLVQADGELPDRNCEFDQSAQSWARKIFNQDLKECVQEIRTNLLSKDQLLMGLITGAVIELVLVPAFPDVLSTPSATSDLYRNMILSYNGPDELHKADLSILSSLMHNRKSEILEDKERDLTEFITRCLGCFWTSRNAERIIQQSPDELAGNIMEHSQEGLVCSGFLMSALDLKLQLTSSLTRVKYTFVRCNALYDDKLMCRANESNIDSSLVKACFLPVLLFAQPREKRMTSSEYVLEHDIDYNTYFTEATEEEMQSLELAVKAIVLT